MCQLRVGSSSMLTVGERKVSESRGVGVDESGFFTLIYYYSTIY